MTLPPIDETIRPGPNHNLDFIDLDELRKKSGSMPSDILRWSLQEMLCNSLDTDANTIEVIVKTVGPYDVITVKDNGTRKITFDDLCLILDFCARAQQGAYASLPASSSLREVLLQENDNQTIEEFLAKMDIWLKLCRLEDAFTALRAGSCTIAAY